MSSLYMGVKVLLPDYVKERLEKGTPQISNERLLELYSKIKPIITIREDKYLLDNLSQMDLRTLSYLSLEKENTNDVIENCKKVDIETLKEIRDFICLHRYGFSLQFRPSVNEVLSQIPEDLIDDIDAFEIVEKPTLPNDLYRYSSKKYHLSRVMTYKLK